MNRLESLGFCLEICRTGEVEVRSYLLQVPHLAIGTGLEESGKCAGVTAHINSVHFAIPSHTSSRFTALQSESLPNLETAHSYLFRHHSGFMKLRRAGMSLIFQ